MRQAARPALRARGASGRDPAVVCAAPAVVPGPSGRAERDLHDPAGAAAARARSTALRWRRRSATWLRGTRACARSSPTRSGCRGSRSWTPDGAAAACGDGGRAKPTLAGALAAAARRGFDLASEPPLRAHLFALGAGARARAAAAAASHCRRRLVAGAAGARSRRAPTRRAARGARRRWPPLPVQYADYTLWQHAVLGDGGAMPRARSRASWRSGRERACRTSRSDRSAERPAAACGGEPSRRQRAARRLRPSCTAACWRLRARAGRACSWCCRPGLRRC